LNSQTNTSEEGISAPGINDAQDSDHTLEEASENDVVPTLHNQTTVNNFFLAQGLS